MGLFNDKIFNSEVFAKYVGTVKDLKRKELLNSGVLANRQDLAARLKDGVGGNLITIPVKGSIGGTPDNYDGSTDITSDSRKTYSQSGIVVGRAHSWTEKDFSEDITGGEDFMPVASEVAAYWDDVDQETLLSILKGVFSMTGAENLKFVNNHTLDITAETESSVGASTLNNAIQKAVGDNKGIFQVAIMHSVVATHLENLQLLEYFKYNDADGMQRSTTLATWNGRIVLIDDNMPVETVAQSGDTPAYNKYTTYLLGKGSILYADCGAKVPYEMARDPKTAGGQTALYSRQRKLFMPEGISFVGSNIMSPTKAQLEAGTNWSLAKDGAAGSPSYIDHKGIAIARIISRG